MPTKTLTVVLQVEDGVYIAECVEIGTAGQGRDIEEAIAACRRATEAYLRERPLPAISRTFITTFEVEVGE